MSESPDLVLYHGPNSRSIRARWMLEVMGLPYRLEAVKFDTRPIGDAAYEAIHPLRKVPVLADNGELVRDSIAIIQYLLGRYGPSELEVRSDEADYGRYLEFLQFGEAGMLMPVNLLIAHTVLLPENHRNPALAKWARSETDKLLKYIAETGLGDGRSYLAAERFTAADISVGYMLYLLKIIKQFDKSHAALNAYFDRLKTRDDWQRASAD